MARPKSTPAIGYQMTNPQTKSGSRSVAIGYNKIPTYGSGSPNGNSLDSLIETDIRKEVDFAIRKMGGKTIRIAGHNSLTHANIPLGVLSVSGTHYSVVSDHFKVADIDDFKDRFKPDDDKTYIVCYAQKTQMKLYLTNEIIDASLKIWIYPIDTCDLDKMIEANHTTFKNPLEFAQFYDLDLGDHRSIQSTIEFINNLNFGPFKNEFVGGWQRWLRWKKQLDNPR